MGAFQLACIPKPPCLNPCLSFHGCPHWNGETFCWWFFFFTWSCFFCNLVFFLFCRWKSVLAIAFSAPPLPLPLCVAFNGLWLSCPPGPRRCTHRLFRRFSWLLAVGASRAFLAHFIHGPYSTDRACHPIDPNFFWEAAARSRQSAGYQHFFSSGMGINRHVFPALCRDMTHLRQP